MTPGIKHIRLASGELAAIDGETGEVIATDAGLRATVRERCARIYPKCEDIPFEPFTEAELNEPNPLILAALNGTLADASAIDIDARPKVPRINTPLPSGYDWHYEGNALALGTDDHGHDFQFDKGTRRLLRITSVSERKRICEYARRYGNKRAAVRFGVSASTVGTWVQRNGGKPRKTRNDLRQCA